MSDEWMERAACATEDRSLFFPDFTGGEYRNSVYAPARAICQGCEVVEECLALAFSFEGPGWRYGMFGGLTPAERDRKFRGVHRCRRCGAAFRGRQNQVFCSEECRQEVRQATIERSRVNA